MSDVAVSLQAEPSTNLQPGQPIRLTITVTNNGPVVLDNFALMSANAYPDQIDVSNPDSDCGDFFLEVTDGATSFWYDEVWYPTDTNHANPGTLPLAVGESRSCHVTIRLVPSAPQTVPFDFHLATYWSDPNPANDVGRVTLQRAVAVPVSTPALSGLAQLLLMLGFAAVGSYAARRCS